METAVCFRYVGLRVEQGEIAAICLQYDSEDSAKAAFAALHNYITSPSGHKSLHVSFLRETTRSYTLNIKIVMPTGVSDTQVSGVEASYVEQIRESLGKFTYYYILAGYTGDEGFTLLSPHEYHIAKRDIIIDGEMVLGTADCSVDWAGLLR